MMTRVYKERPPNVSERVSELTARIVDCFGGHLLVSFLLPPESSVPHAHTHSPPHAPTYTRAQPERWHSSIELLYKVSGAGVGQTIESSSSSSSFSSSSLQSGAADRMDTLYVVRFGATPRDCFLVHMHPRPNCVRAGAAVTDMLASMRRLQPKLRVTCDGAAYAVADFVVRLGTCSVGGRAARELVVEVTYNACASVGFVAAAAASNDASSSSSLPLPPLRGECGATPLLEEFMRALVGDANGTGGRGDNNGSGSGGGATSSPLLPSMYDCYAKYGLLPAATQTSLSQSSSSNLSSSSSPSSSSMSSPVVWSHRHLAVEYASVFM
jgi:hypothetical protein